MGKVERKDFEKVPKTLKPAIKASGKTSGLFLVDLALPL